MPVEEEIVSLGKSMGLEGDEADVNDLVEEHAEELTTEELKELHTQQHTEILQEINEPEAEEITSTSEMKEVLGMWEKVAEFVKKKHLEKIATSRASALFNDTCLNHFCNILKGRKKQTSLDRFLLKHPAREKEESVAIKSKNSEEK